MLEKGNRMYEWRVESWVTRLYSHGLADSYTCRYSWQIALVLFVLLEMDNNAFTSL